MDLHCFFYHIRHPCLSLLLVKNKRHIDCLFVCIAAFAINEAFFKNFNITFLKNHFNDLLAMPAMLSYINLVLSFFGKQFFLLLVAVDLSGKSLQFGPNRVQLAMSWTFSAT